MMEIFSLDDIPLFEESQHSNRLNVDDSIPNTVDESDSLLNVDDLVPNTVDESVPTVEMCFDTTNGVKSFYRQYTIKKGFVIRTRSSKKAHEKELKYFMLVCARVGKYMSAIPSEMNMKPTQSVECPTRITVRIKEDK